jgi:hypothetical protein
MAYVVRFPHHLEIDGVPLSTPAWEHLNIQTLYSGPETRGDNRVMPGAAGRRALPWRADQTMRTLTLAIFGGLRWDGAANPDAVAGLWANVAHFIANIVDTPNTPGCTRTAVIKRTGAADLTATIQVRGFEIDDNPYSPGDVAASLDIALLAGGFR